MPLPSLEHAPLFEVRTSSPQFSERCIQVLLALATVIPLSVVVAIVVVFIYQSGLFFQVVSLWQFLTDTQWTPHFSRQRFGILVLVSGTVLVNAIALAVAIPVGVLSAIYLSEYAPRSVKLTIRPLLGALSGIPTVVYGYFALLLVTPYLRLVIPGLSIFNGLSAGLVTGILITPMIASLSEDALQGVDTTYRHAAYACGLTQFELVWNVLLPEALPGILASFTLAASRGLGETMIAAIATGHNPNLTLNPLVPIETMTAFIVQVSLGDISTDSLLFNAIFALGMVLFLMTLTLNSFGNWLVYRYRRLQERQGRPTADSSLQRTMAHVTPEPFYLTPASFASTVGQRRWVNRVFSLLGLLSSLVAPGFLGLLILVTLRLGLPQLNWQFLSSLTSSEPAQVGILAALAGSLWLLGLTLLFALPIGIASAIYLEEYLPPGIWNRLVEINLANATAVPGILYGLLGLAVFVDAGQRVTGGRSILSAALMMTLLVLPLLITASRAALRQVPFSLKWSGYAVGMSRWQVIWYIILPAARPGLLTGFLLTASRILGETSPLIALGAVESITFVPAFTLEGLQSPFTTLTTQLFFWLSLPQTIFREKAAAAVIVLGTIVLIMNGVAALIRDRIQRVS